MSHLGTTTGAEMDCRRLSTERVEKVLNLPGDRVFRFDASKGIHFLMLGDAERAVCTVP